jgi:serine/threonine protein kinase
MLTEGQDILEGRFQIVKKIGSGAFGEIYKGKQILYLKVYIVEKKKTGETRKKADVTS